MGEGLTLPCPKIVRGQLHLTPQQLAYVREFARERIAAQLSTAPLDEQKAAIEEQKAEEHLREAYRVVGRKPPTTMRWFDSPYSFAAASVWAGVVRSVEVNVRTNLADSIKASMEGCMRDDARPGIETIVRNGVGVATWANMGTNLRAGARLIVHNSLKAYFNAPELAAYRFSHEIFEENKLIHLAHFNELVSGYWLGRKEVWLVRKPVVLQLDEQGRLHNASGPAVWYRDGWGHYVWHGVRVPEKIIMHPEQLTRKDWTGQRNVEVRRAIQERLGPERFGELVGARSIDKGRRGNLVEIKLGRDPEAVAHYVQVQDSSTERQYYLRVPPSITRADEAVAWTFGLAESDYRPGQET